MLANRRFSTYLPLLLLLLIFVISFVFYLDGLNGNRAPPGCDYGNYLTQVDILRGNDLRGWGLQHNPVFFIFLDVFLRVFEEFTALKIVAALIFSMISIPFFLFARKISGNNLVSLICTWLLVYFLTNAEMISWGGNPNFLGFSFMLLTLFFFVDLMNQPSKKNLLLSAFFMGLVIGTHILVATYMFLAIFVYFVGTMLVNKEISKIRIKSLFFMILIGIVFSLPYSSFYLNFFTSSSDEMLGANIFSQIPPISFSSVLGLLQYWQLFVVPIVLGLGLFALSEYVKGEHRTSGLLLASLLLSPLILALVTAQPIRWIYFLPIPMILCFGIYLKDVFFYLQDVVFKIEKSKKTLQLLAICFIFIIGLFVTVLTYTHLHRVATEVYQFIGEDEIEALNWIKNNTSTDTILATSGHTKGDIGGGGNSYSWWVEGYSKRVCIPSGDLQYYSYQHQRDEVKIANRIFSGIYSIDYKNIRVTESHPSGLTNPEIAALVNGEYQDILTLNDAQHQLFFSTNKDGLTFENSTTRDGLTFENSTTSIDAPSYTWANITVTYEHPYFDAVRNVIIGEDNSSVDVIFQIQPKSTELTLFKINLFGLFKTKREACNITDNVVNLSKKENIQVHIALLEDTNDDPRERRTRIFFEDPKGSVPIVSYALKPLQDSLYVHIRIYVEPSVNNNNDVEELIFYDSYDLIKELNIDYILLNRGRTVQFRRFLAESERFTQVFNTPDTLIIFKVN
jgi:hypothetical protein